MSKIIRGAAHHSTPLTEDDVRQIRKDYAAYVQPGKIAERYGISRVAIWKIVNGRSWRHVE